MLAQKALPGLLTPGTGWAGRVFEAGLRGLYQHLRNLGLEPGEELLAAMQARRSGTSAVWRPVWARDGVTRCD